MSVSKVSNFLQSNFNNLSTSFNIHNNNLNSITPGKLASSLSNPQITANAAKIIDRSPLEADFEPSTSHIKENPYKYQTIFYPQDVANLPTGHYMRFDIYQNNKQKYVKNNPKGAGPDASERLKAAKLYNEASFGRQSPIGRLGRALSVPFGGSTVGSDKEAFELAPSDNKRQSGIQRNNNTHAFIEATILLYTPPQVKTTYAATYADAETAGSGAVTGSKNFGDFLMNAGKSVLMGVRDVVMNLAGTIPNAGDVAAATSKKTGTAKNPNMELVFKSVPFRKFEYTFEFSPRNQKEVDSINKILKLFRFHMQPGLQGGSSAFFEVPSEFELTYMYIDKQNKYIPKIARCVLTDMTIDQSPEGVFTTFKSDQEGAFPTSTKLTLTFQENEIMTKEKVAEGF